MNFQNELIKWYHQHKRALPWRESTDAYVIWLSEIILQQTRVEQGLPYFYRFLESFPTVGDFAAATENQVLKLWQGLGYYSRGRNMLFTAREVMEKHGGQFPVAYAELVLLKGIGAYTAAAISSFSNNEEKAVLDGNVFRVLARYFGIDKPINSTEGKKIFSQLAQDLIIGQPAAVYNQAIMEFGALQCKPKSPLCASCPLITGCYAFQHQKIDVLPAKLKKTKVRQRWFNYFVAKDEDQLLVKQRVAGDIWQQLYDFPLVETGAPPQINDPEFIASIQKMFGSQAKIQSIAQKKHLLTHQIIYVHFFALENYMINFKLYPALKSVSLAEFHQLPHPKVIEEFTARYLT
ncbi:MAG: A/G-specific adenine glycosylase [Pedobacter sp.]|nr:A/G-specific adenine glycosylase [Pedobacter sp.]MDQ8052698.1 A/G-specific adenine glycosylase [Pedobacter sp.]